MEIHRLKEMGDYDQELFNHLYSKTAMLRKKLASRINPKLFNVTPDIVESWFDDKFIYVFNKYHQDEDKRPRLLGYIINSLSCFQNRILRNGYKESIENHTVDIGELNEIENYLVADNIEQDNKELFLNLALAFMEKELEYDAFKIFQLELNPPSYITSKLRSPNSKIPSRLILEFLELPDTQEYKNYIGYLRDQIEEATTKARKELNPNLALLI